MGPGPPQRKQREQKEKERERERQRGDRGLATGGVGSSAITGTSSADTVVGSETTDGRETEQERNRGEGWNRRRYQREDEMLWGIHQNNDSRRGTPDTGRSRAGTTGSASSYRYGCNPAVNDLHPPIVSTRPTSKSEMRWMLQPPPPARVMEGKERANRSRSGSGGSYGSGRSNTSNRRTEPKLARRMGERLIEGRMHRDASLDSPLKSKAQSREDVTSTGSRNLNGQPHDRDRSPSNESEKSSDRSISSSRKAPPPPISIPSDLRPSASRPPLSTIDSTSNVTCPTAPTKLKLLRPALLPMDSSSSLHVLQELVSPLSLDQGSVGDQMRLNIMRRATSPLPEARIELPPTDDVEERSLGLPILESHFPSKAGWQLSP